MSKTSKTLFIIGGILVVVVLVGIIGIALVADSLGKPGVPENSVLVLNISGDLPDYVPEEPFAKAFGVGQTQSFSSLLTQLRKAKVDSHGIFMTWICFFLIFSANSVLGMKCHNIKSE